MADIPMYGPTDEWTDGTSYRDAWTYLKPFNLDFSFLMKRTDQPWGGHTDVQMNVHMYRLTNGPMYVQTDGWTKKTDKRSVLYQCENAHGHFYEIDEIHKSSVFTKA